MAVLQNEVFTFINNASTGSFRISFPNQRNINLADNLVSVSGQLADGTKFSESLLFAHSEVPDSHLLPESYSICFSGILDSAEINWRTEFTFSEVGDILKWKISLSNHSMADIFLDRIDVLRPSSRDESNFSFGDPSIAEPACFSNGWQSWSHSGAYTRGERMHNSRLGIFQEPMILNPGTPKYKQTGLFSSNMFTVVGDKISGAGLVLGFLSQGEQFGSLSVKIESSLSVSAWANCDHVRLEPGSSLHTDWFAVTPCDLRDQFSIDPYLDAVKKAHQILKQEQVPAGWSSWYYYYQDISEQIITNNVYALAERKGTLPIELVQIDDGFQSQVGDWQSFNEKFPNGVAGLAQEIKKNEYTPGIWLAPFIVHPRSQLAKEHPGWLLRKKNGKLARAGFGWNSLTLALDLTVPDALDYVRRVIRTAVQDWGFAYLKLDFLYAAALACKYADDRFTRAQVMRRGMLAVREAAGEDTILLGCGAPLGSMLGLVEVMRISADVSGHWLPKIFNIGFPFRQERCVPSVRNAIKNIITRAWSHNKWWVNNPDCLLVRDTTGLSLDEVRTLASVIAMSGGSVMLSEDMNMLSPERLRIASAVVPPINQRPKVLDWMASGTPARMRVDLEGAVGKWYLISYSNWSAEPLNVELAKDDFGLPDGDYWVSNFWQEKIWRAPLKAPLFSGDVPPHATLLFAVRSCIEGTQYAAGNLHVSQGLEMQELMERENYLRVTFDASKWLHGFIELQLEKTPVKVKMGEHEIAWEQTEIGTYRFNFPSIPPGEMIINY